MDALIISIEQAYTDFSSERDLFVAASEIDRYLFAALFLAKSGASLSEQSAPSSGVVDRLNKIDAFLNFCEDLMVDETISRQALTAAGKANVRTDVAINQADVMPLGNNGINLVQNGTGAITSTASNPLTAVTDVAASSATYELGGVSVSIGGAAVPMISVSPTAITFYVPADLPGGLADVVVTTRDGYIMHSTASVNGLNPTILGSQGEASSSAAIFNALELRRDGLSAFTSWWFGFDQQTRLSIVATGVSTGLTNTNVSNDVFLSNGKLMENYAESVQVEARTAGGQTYMLPVEFAGANGTLRGLDQITVRLVPELAGKGSVQITVIAGGRRSNTSMVTVN